MIAVAAGALVAGAIAVPAAASRSAGGCSARGNVIARDSVAVVYSSGGSAYACANSAGKTYKLGTTGICIGVRRASPFTLAREVVAYGLTECGVDASSTQVVALNLATGKTLRNDPDVSIAPPEAYGSVTSLVVKADGSDAWIATDRSLGSGVRIVQVWRHDRHGLTRLDSGLRVSLGSLKLSRSRLTWRNGSATRHASLS